MVKRNKGATVRNVPDFEEELDEVDEFHKNKEEILLNESGTAQGDYEEEELSDEEVLGLSAEESEDDMDTDEDYYGIKKDRHDEQESEEDGWGTAKNNYYGADDVNEDEDAAKEEEKEALRIQKKHLSDLKMEDYFDNDDMEEWAQAAELEDRAAELDGADVALDKDPSFLNPNERLELLRSAYPEVGPLSEELLSLNKELETLRPTAGESETQSMKFAALSCYIATIYSYFALFVNKLERGRVDLKGHAVMEGILKSREMWRLLHNAKEQTQDLNGGYDDSDVESVVSGAASEASASSPFSLDESVESSDEEHHDHKAATKDEFAISRPQKVKQSKKKSISTNSDEQDVDVEEKEARKRSLRFYTSKIDQKSNKINERYGGDDDLPYKERNFERQKRLMEEARLRGLKTGSKDEADEFGSGSDEEERSANEEADGDDYYETVKQTAAQKKLARKQAHEVAVQAAKEGRLSELMQDMVDGGSKRAINYQILKNRGLTANRSKDNRNPRVKKRKKYEAAKKKLKSIRSVHQQPTTVYGGELTGIKKNIVKSVKFKS